jgi:regulator of sigma E protease
METVLIKAAQLVLALSILVFVHELGHFGFARLFKVRVNKFYLFFNPNFSIFRAKKINGKWQFRFFAKNLPDHVRQSIDEFGIPRTDKKGHPIMEPAPLSELDDNDWRKHPETTEWGIGWVPLGGYCAIDGMADETTDASMLSAEVKPWEFRAKPAWQRMFIIAGGVLMNFITAAIIYAMMLYTWGQEYIPMENAYLGYDYCQTALNNGFQNGDRIITIDGDTIEQQQDFVSKAVIEGKQNVVVLRNGEEVNITLPKDFGEQVIAANEKGLLQLRIPFVIGIVAEGTPAQAAGLQPNDSIIGINDKHLVAYSDIVKELDTLKGETITVSFIRNDSTMRLPLTLTDEGKMGVQIDPNLTRYFKTKKIEYGFFESFPAGIKQGWEGLVNYVKQFRLVFTKAGAQSVGGFVAIGNMFPSTWDWSIFWSFTAFLSLALAFMNFLPIPVLDGGYFLMLIYEMITGRKPSDKFMEIASNIGMFLLLALLIFANGNDIIKLIMGKF